MISKKKKILDAFVLEFESGRLAKQANGSVLGCYGETMVLANSVMSKEEKTDVDFFPLQINYIEKFYSVGRIPGGYFKREGRPRDKELLISRMIDRPLRPLFSQDLRKEIQVSAMTVSFDPGYAPDILSIIVSSLSLCISDIPFNGPIGAIRLGIDKENRIFVNTSAMDLEEEVMDLVVVGKEDKILMLEGGFKEISEEVLLEALELSKKYIKEIIDFQLEFVDLCKKEKQSVHVISENKKLKDRFVELAKSKIREAFLEKEKKNRNEFLIELSTKVLEILKQEFEEQDLKDYKKLWGDLEYEVARDMILFEEKRIDHRLMDEVRNIEVDINILPRTHGSALFTRGETQSLTTVTLGSSIDAQRMDNLDKESSSRFLVHYNFPPFSVGEVGKIMVGRREIGHGQLIYRSLLPILPDFKDFPYTIRVVSEILESNGSSSMASVSSGSMALFDAGVPIKEPVAGIAMGLVSLEDRYQILTDIQGIEDYSGDMDFKIAGTRSGVTGIQLDTKLEGIDYQIIIESLEKAKNARLAILDIMNLKISKPNELSVYAPRVVTFSVPMDKIRDIIGPSGRNIRTIIEKTETLIELKDDGSVIIVGKSQEGVDKASTEIKKYVEEVKVGNLYEGIIKKVAEYGVFVEVLPFKEGLCHVSKLSSKPITNIRKLYKEGDPIKVKCIYIDSATNKITLSALTDSNYRDNNYRSDSNYRSDNSNRDSNYRSDNSNRDSNYRSDNSNRDSNYRSDNSNRDSNYRSDSNNRRFTKTKR